MFLIFDYLVYVCVLNNWYVGNNIVIINCDYWMDVVVYSGVERVSVGYLNIYIFNLVLL